MRAVFTPCFYPPETIYFTHSGGFPGPAGTQPANPGGRVVSDLPETPDPAPVLPRISCL